jgi:hypothetical protein
MEHVGEASPQRAPLRMVEEVPNKMRPKANPLECPFGCGYDAMSEDDLSDHVAGCQPNDAG